MGQHRLLCGDAADTAPVARLMGGEKATLTVTSPPYNLGSTPGITGLPLAGQDGAPWRGSKYREQADRRTPAQYRDLLIAATENALAVATVAIVFFQQLAGNRVAFLEYLPASPHRHRHLAQGRGPPRRRPERPEQPL